ncbi:MAG: response regulator [Polyangiaceae bacterium]|nr:response regulator [Polyangiaceae bacterium]
MRILIVDDNVVFAQVMRRALVEKGHDCGVVHDINDAEEAVVMNTFDVVVTDLHVHQASGLSLLERVMLLCPGALRILMSGSADADALAAGIRVSHMQLLKPFSLDALCDILEEHERRT